MDPFREPKRFGDFALRVMIPCRNVNRDVGLPKFAHLRDEIKPGVVILPVPVIEIPGNEHEGDILGYGKVHHVFESPPRGMAQFFNRRAFIVIELVQGTVQVDVRGMNKLEHRLLSFLQESALRPIP